MWLYADETKKCGDHVYWTLSDGVLTISGKGRMYDYEYVQNHSPWYNNTDIKKVVIRLLKNYFGRENL